MNQDLTSGDIWILNISNFSEEDYQDLKVIVSDYLNKKGKKWKEYCFEEKDGN